jgi:sigma-B regulation protein RsbU (phosphoserine phosphatase)
VNAGHPAPLLVNGPISDLLEATGPLIGPLPEIAIKRGYSYLAPGAVLLLYTDGVFERRNKLGESFSIGRLREAVSQNQTKSAKDILNILFEEAYQFGGRLPWEDDVSLVVIKREG